MSALTTVTRNVNTAAPPATGSSASVYDVAAADRDHRFKAIIQRQLGPTGLTLVTNLTMLFLIAFVTLIGVMVALMGGGAFGCRDRASRDAATASGASRSATSAAADGSGNGNGGGIQMALLLPRQSVPAKN